MIATRPVGRVIQQGYAFRNRQPESDCRDVNSLAPAEPCQKLGGAAIAQRDTVGYSRTQMDARVPPGFHSQKPSVRKCERTALFRMLSGLVTATSKPQRSRLS